jgi:hypothetical protein
MSRSHGSLRMPNEKVVRIAAATAAPQDRAIDHLRRTGIEAQSYDRRPAERLMTRQTKIARVPIVDTTGASGRVQL